MPILKQTNNYLYNYILKTWVINRSRRDPDTGDRATVTILNGGGSRCFDKDTLIETDNGSKKISELSVGDHVQSFNHKENCKEFKRVENVIKNENNTKKCYKIKFKNGDELKCTFDHEIYLNGKYKTADEIFGIWKRCDYNPVTKATNFTIQSIRNIEEIELSDTYDLTVEGNSNYYVAANNGTLVHNSSKTVSIAQVILTIMENFSDKKAKNHRELKIIVYRDTLVSARDTFSDFIDAFTGIGLKERELNDKGVMEGDYEKTTSPKPTITYKGHLIEFKGIPPVGKEPRGCDISFINELIENNNQDSFYGIIRRTSLLVLADWNPKASVHWAYNIKMFNVFYTTTTYLDNKWLPNGLKSKAEAQCPWDFSECEYYLETYTDYGEKQLKKLPEDFTLEKWYSGYYQKPDSPIQFDGFLRRRWLKEERPENCKPEDFHKYRSVNKLNYENGTINRSNWLTYGSGVPSGQEGAIFANVNWVDELPNELDNSYLGLDYGFSADPSALVICGNIGMKMYIKKLCYQKTGTSDLLFDLIERPLLEEEKRRYIEANSEEWYEKLLELRYKRKLAYAAQYVNLEEKDRETDAATDALNEHIERGLPIESIYIVTDTADGYKGRGEANEQLFTLDLNLKAQQNGYDWKFVKVGSKPIISGLALMKKFDLHFIKDRDLQTEVENYCYIKDDAGNLTNLPDKESKFNHAIDAARYTIWKFFKYIFPS